METVDKSHVLGVTKINIITIILGYEKCEVCNKNVICFSEILYTMKQHCKTRLFSPFFHLSHKSSIKLNVHVN